MEEEKKTISRIVLLDANALIHRAYHGLPPLTTKDGLLVNAVYGFTTTLFKALDDFAPKYLAVAFDVKGPTIRHKEFKEYKATRPPMPEELFKQLTLVKEVCKVLNVPVFGIEGYEADDVIGTLDKQAGEKNISAVVVTGDMDTLQLVDKDTEVYSMSRGIKQAEIFDTEKVKEKYGFQPEQLVDYKALRGDPSDNIPGVPGIGEVTASNLIKQFGTIENIYSKISNSQFLISNQTPNPKSKIPNSFPNPKTINLLLQYRDQSFLSKKLATIIRDVPIKLDLTDCQVHDYDRKEAEKLFRKLEFKSLLSRLPEEKRNNQQSRLF